MPIRSFHALNGAPVQPGTLATDTGGAATSRSQWDTLIPAPVAILIAGLVTVLVAVTFLGFLVGPQDGLGQTAAPETREPDVYGLMTDCANKAITRNNGDLSMAILQTQPLIDCANGQLSSNQDWNCDEEGCWQDGSGHYWLKIFSAIEDSSTQVPPGEPAEEDYVQWCQQELGMGEDECRTIWQNT